MEEEQVTIEGETRALDQPFFVIATQNPLEYAGTFPLPESQMDRFLMRIELGYPDRGAERQILKGRGAQAALEKLHHCMAKEDVRRVQEAVGRVHTSDAFLAYLQDILDFTRTSPQFHVGLSPRAGLALARAARCWAYLHGREYTIPEDLQKVLLWVAGHRLRTRSERSELPRNRLIDLFKQVPVPV
jgi:MoxR-like ATPase